MRASQLESTADTHTQFVPPLGKRVTESICTVFTVNATTAEYPQATRDKLSQLPGERLMQRPMRVANTVRIKVFKCFTHLYTGFANNGSHTRAELLP